MEENNTDLTFSTPENKARQGFVDKFSQKLTDGLGKETGFPPISIDIYLSRHVTKKDAEGFKKHLKKADVFIPEMIQWDSGVLSTFRKVSSGKITVDEGMIPFKNIIGSNFIRGMLENLHGTQKVVGIIDFPKGHNAGESLSKWLSEWGDKMWDCHWDGNFQGALELTRESIVHWADVNKEREEFITAQFPEAMREIFDTYPELKSKAKVNVLIQIGATHTTVAGLFRKGGYEEVKRHYPEIPYIFPLNSSLGIKRYYGKDINDEDVARVVFGAELEEDGVLDVVPFDSYSYYSAVVNDVMSKFTLPEIRKVYSSLKGLTTEKRQKKLTDILKSKNVSVPIVLSQESTQ